MKVLKYSNVWLNIFVNYAVLNKLQVSLENYQINQNHFLQMFKNRFCAGQIVIGQGELFKLVICKELYIHLKRKIREQSSLFK